MKSVFFDIDCLVSFIMIDRLDLLEKLFSKISITNKVYETYNNPSIPINIRLMINALVNNGFIKIEDITLNTNVSNLYFSLIENLEDNDKIIGKGEASTIALAVRHDATVLCNDCENVSFYLDKYNLKSLNVGDIIVKLYEKEYISHDEAEDIWIEMKNKGVPLLENSFNDYLNKS